ncbi:wax ester/triacylglycerol synthase domain-containing protein [Paraneptunicella aestuarii]|uniref:wax ester/triacylglycerol synthase domain-containing protein n=1 Tax=Paraneptunicella aestuarii TaxID=2831148 RepID=UPI001E5D7D23|nr:wax ester/triacylglycerol synthase domain-containing protein [Paraneptunicella aestuarii]
MMRKSISFLDMTFWITESKDNPKHVASLQLLEMPSDAGADYIDNLVVELRKFSQAVVPFNMVVRTFLGLPLWLKSVDKLDMNYHVQVMDIDDVSDNLELHKVVARLHEPRLDRDKPLWQYVVIRGKTGNRFAIYTKIHHMYGDGASMVKWFQAGYLPEPQKESFTPIWAVERKRRHRPKKKFLARVFSAVWESIVVVIDLFWIMLRLWLKILYINREYMPIPFTGTKTMLTGQVKQGRVVSTVDMDFQRVQKVAKKLRATVNEVLLCCFDIGVRRYLSDEGQIFERALYTNMPINMRKPGDNTSGNKIAIVPVKLAHGQNDPYIRLRQIIENHRIVKRAARRAHPAAFSAYTVLIQSFALLFEILRISDWVRPIANILISNVPGPKEIRYFGESKLLAVYPISTIVPGGGVNITLLTYGDTANVGIVCSDRKIKSVENMALYFNDAFELLEKSVEDYTVSIQDIGERVIDDHKAIIDENHYPDEDDSN